MGNAIGRLGGFNKTIKEPQDFSQNVVFIECYQIRIKLTHVERKWTPAYESFL
jgi:hypothetical protein